MSGAMTLPTPVDHLTIFNSVMPPEGPKAVPVNLDFTSAGTLLVDFTLPMLQKRISAIQTLSVRNWLNSASISFTVQGIPEPFDIPAYTDVVMPVPAANLTKFIFTTTSSLIIPVTFFNVPLPSVTLVNPAGGAAIVVLGTVTVTGTVDTIAITGTPAAAAAHSVAVGGTAVAALVNPAKGGKVVNPLAAVESLFADLVNNAGTVAPGASGTTIEIAPGATLDVPPLTGTVSVNAATGGHTFTAYSLA